MKVAFHLRRRPSPEPASAVLLETDSVVALLELAAKLGLDRTPPIHRVAGGFLLKLAPGVAPPIGPIRLRQVAENLYLPVDADLVPALLDDEAQGITRDHGLIFLPSGKILGFEPGRPLPLSVLVRIDPHQASGWQPFPARPSRVERLQEITLDLVEGMEGDLFGPGEDPMEIGTEGPPRPEDAGAASTLAGRAAVGAGKGLIGLGAILGIKALADLGAKWINNAVEHVPRLTEAILGKQEGALRELLRQFREGDIERALRHALPLGGTGGRGGKPATDGKLPTVDPTYSLQSLLGSNRGSNGIWFGGFDVQLELAKEYRKAAEEAERMGDFRRAAYIYGKLLNDFTTAAYMLARGGLHRDAAFIYLDRLKDIPAAARAFEAAGEVDRALVLYRRNRLHAEAGDLLRRVGEEDAAVSEYVFAANLLAADSHYGQIAAGDLLKDRARRPDLALAYYSVGWERRSATSAVPCALKMAAIYADQGDVSRLTDLVVQADELLHRPGPEAPAVDFYNELARLAERENLALIRDDLRDISLRGLATKIRQQVGRQNRPGAMPSNYFGRNKAWSNDMVDDATHALKSAFDLEAERRRLSRMILGPSSRGEPRRFEVDGGIVSAACHAHLTGEVFLGFEGGRVYRFEVSSGLVSCVLDEGSPVCSMAVDAEGRTLVLILGEEPGPWRLVHLSRVPTAATGWSKQSRTIDGAGDFWLTPVITDGSNTAVGILNGKEMVLMGGIDDLAVWTRLAMPFLKTEPPAALLIPPSDGRPPTPRAVLVHDGPDICHVESTGKMLRRRLLGWRPTLPEGHTLRSAPLAWLQVEPERFELAGLDREGVIHWSSLKLNDAELIRTANNVSTGDTVYAATALVRPGLVAGVTQGKAGGLGRFAQARVDWLRCGSQTFTAAGSSNLVVVSPLACFPAHRSDELVVVSQDGRLVCVPTPR